VIPSSTRNLQVGVPTVIYECLHTSFVYFGRPSNFLKLWPLVPQLPWSCRGQTCFFLQLWTTLMGFGFSFHTRLRMVTSSGWLDNCCCKRILRTIDSFPSLFHRSIRKLVACLQISGLLFLSVHLSVYDRQSYSPGVFLKLCVGFFRIERWIEFLYARLFILVPHVI